MPVDSEGCAAAPPDSPSAPQTPTSESTCAAVPPKSDGCSVFVAWTMCVNLLVGACLLNVPHAFARTGIPFSVAFLMLVSGACYITACYLIEVQSRANALVRSLQQAASSSLPSRSFCRGRLHSPAPWEDQVEDEPNSAGSWTAPLPVNGAVEVAFGCIAEDEEQRRSGQPPRHVTPAPPRAEDYIVADSVLEVNQMCRVFLGPVGQHVWEACVIAWVYICLWLYLAIMAQTILTSVPLPGLTSHGECDMYQAAPLSPQCGLAYKVWLVAVWALMLPAVLMDLRELGSLQLVLNALVYVVVGTMVITVWVAMLREPYDPASAARATPPHVAPQTVFSAEGFSLLFSATVFGQMGHIGVPSITSVLKDKSQAKRVWLLGFLTNASLQTLLSVSCVLFFGSHTSPISTLNWKDYTAGQSPGQAPGWAAAISWLVVMMPVVTISASYPLQSGALASNLLHAIPRRAWAVLCGQRRHEGADAALDPLLDSPALADEWPPMRVTVAAKLLTVVPPLLPALLVKDAAKITRVGGLVGFLLSLLIPCVLQYWSTRAFRRLWPSAPHAASTPYASRFSGELCVALVLGVSMAAFGFSAWDTARQLGGWR